jgi:hypothetical protein
LGHVAQAGVIDEFNQPGFGVHDVAFGAWRVVDRLDSGFGLFAAGVQKHSAYIQLSQ